MYKKIEAIRLKLLWIALIAEFRSLRLLSLSSIVINSMGQDYDMKSLFVLLQAISFGLMVHTHVAHGMILK